MSEPDYDFHARIHDDLKQRVRELNDEVATLRSLRNVLQDKLESALDMATQKTNDWMKARDRADELEKNLANAWRNIEDLTKQLDESRQREIVLDELANRSRGAF